MQNNIRDRNVIADIRTNNNMLCFNCTIWLCNFLLLCSSVLIFFACAVDLASQKLIQDEIFLFKQLFSSSCHHGDVFCDPHIRYLF